MTDPRHIAVIDVGKTNAKLALVDAATLREIAVETRPNTVRPGPPWPHFDLEGHWGFFLAGLQRFHAEHGVDAISVTTHGAAAVLLDASGELAAPMLDYEHDGPDGVRAAYDALRPGFAETGAPRLPMGLNLGAQLHWMLGEDPGLDARLAHVVTYPQYWGFRLTGELATDVTSLGCHTDLWEPWTGRPSALVGRLGLADRLAPPRRATEILGTVTPEVAQRTGLSPQTPVATGIHDSNASLYPHVLTRTPPFSVVSTGTWVVAMAVGGASVALDPARDTLVNVNALAQPVPSARFMGGREYELIREGRAATPDANDRRAVLSGRLRLLPSVETGSGPFAGRAGGWSHRPETEGQAMLALSWYLALMTDVCLGLAGAAGPVVVEGPFARNADYLDMLAALRPEGVIAMGSATGTSTGAALLFAGDGAEAGGEPVTASDAQALRAYAADWQGAVERDEVLAAGP
ncbi:FGGY-family carbohydrate kinase [Salipiger mucosus]|uniref:Rhamnulokinase RhaK in alpha-proteobacteria n=1 Tax=Salipiger mucosus DSM 16094 TaxID=1123237 RepID=S9R534_9RHOB|nr:FGGY-family carbohydrate kinase [Salipiger mucosus]EPX87068.1 Rhamnulokinase RhaK in alpha-proteobacteria [Salipiger mucosus DSM 16094]